MVTKEGKEFLGAIDPTGIHVGFDQRSRELDNLYGVDEKEGNFYVPVEEYNEWREQDSY